MRTTLLGVVLLVACGGGGGVVDAGDGDGDGDGDPLEPVPSVDTDPSHYPDNVWVTGAMAKVQPVDAAPENEKWALLWAARNEVESFQVHVQAGGADAELEVTASELVDEVSGRSLTAQVWREGYMDVTTR